MKDKYFIDTNIFVYSFDGQDADKQSIARGLIREALADSLGVISSQVIQEFLNVATKKFNPPLHFHDAVKYFNSVLEPLCEIYTHPDLYLHSLDIMERWKYSFYDSLIIAAALMLECKILFSEDLQHGQKIQGLQIINPFKID